MFSLGDSVAFLVKTKNSILSDKKIVFKLARDAASALMELQSSNIVHCDLAPRNLLVQKIRNEYRLRICDFGLGRLRYKQGPATGDPLMDQIRQAPEVLGDYNISVQSDVYSFGLVLWEMFTGKTLEQVFYGIYNPVVIITNPNNPKRTPQLPDTLQPPELRSLLKKMWAFEASDRPTVKQVYKDLTALSRIFY